MLVLLFRDALLRQHSLVKEAGQGCFHLIKQKEPPNTFPPSCSSLFDDNSERQGLFCRGLIVMSRSHLRSLRNIWPDVHFRHRGSF